MISETFKILEVNLTTGQSGPRDRDGAALYLGGSGLAARLHLDLARPDLAWDDPTQPLIFAIGPLTGYFPLMSKTVCAFTSPVHGQYAESHAGGRGALAMRFAGYDALVITGRAERPVVLHLGENRIDIIEAGYLWGQDALASGKLLRRMLKGSGHRTIMRIGPAGENKSAMACVNVDTYRHFGRLGGGAVMGAKNLKAIAIEGEGARELPAGKSYAALFRDIFRQVTDTDMMRKYHNLGTAANLDALNDLKALPWRNLQATSDPGITGITGQRFADDTLLRNAACSGCPVGCIHIGFVREKFQADNQYFYRQVPYDYEPIFATGSMLGLTHAPDVLSVMDEIEKAGLDVMSGGVALAWATEALEKGVVTPEQVGLGLRFGQARGYMEAVHLLAAGKTEFWRLLAQGTMTAARHYGGEDFACVLGQEMAGYATGEVFYVAQSLGLRHSHLDTGAYSYDQSNAPKDVAKALAFLLEDERERVIQTSMVACLFARKVYGLDSLRACLNVLGGATLADGLEQAGGRIQKLRWRARLAGGFDPMRASIPKRFLEVTTWKGQTDPVYLENLRQAYATAIRDMGRADAEKA
ncbi:MAG: aldehyde ferredoxin oxidoreductase [Deltaproteobacteria bacterium]|nr:aldehyde ferredoxin oxidoreductase [Deltaproteobacteria bacterium]